MSRIPELQDAVRKVPGVAHAVVRWPEVDGPATLRVEFAEGADRATATEEIVRLLQRIGGVDPADMRIGMGPAADERGERPLFSSLTVDHSQRDVFVEVSLSYGGREHAGSAHGLVTPEGDLRATAEATVEALNGLFGPELGFELRRIAIGEVDLDVTRIEAVVRVIEDDAVLDLIGSALVRRDTRESAVRAILDAVNRRLTRHLSPTLAA